ncbi:MAG: hypothetical protein ACRDFC_04690 [Ignavibacteria bacterium]
MESTIEKQKIITVQTFLKIIFGVVPIVAGLDKFTNLLVHWEIYINPMFLSILPFSGEVFMYAVGVIEIGAGIIVIVQPRIGAYIVSAWLVCISLSLLFSGHFLDVAVRDLVMAAGAFTLARLTELIGDEQMSKEKVLVSAHNR